MKTIIIFLSISALYLTSCGEAPHGHNHDEEHDHSHGEQHHFDNDEYHEHHKQESFKVEKDTLESQVENHTH